MTTILKKQRIIEILFESFNENKSTNFVIKQDNKREKRLRTLIEFSIFNGEKFGRTYLTENGRSCAIVLNSEKKKTTLRSVFWTLKLIFSCVGIGNIGKVLKRESIIKGFHPKSDFIHLWYIGVEKSSQGSGLGTKLMQQIIDEAKAENKSIYLETSTVRNFNFYKKFGFEEVATIDQLGYSIKIFCLI